MNTTYAGSATRITDPLPVFRCRHCGRVTWAVTADKPIRCTKCGSRMVREAREK